VPVNGENGTSALFCLTDSVSLTRPFAYQDFLDRLGSLAAHDLGIVRFPPAYHHEAADQVSRCYHSIAIGPSRHGTVLCVLDHFQLFDLFSVRRGLE
jgi:hypothetical protein